jgi:hypothetical protein
MPPVDLPPVAEEHATRGGSGRLGEGQAPNVDVVGEAADRERVLGRFVRAGSSRAVWGFDFAPGSNVVDVYVAQLRTKLGRDRIETVRGAGYRLRR